MRQDLRQGHDVCLVGGKGAGKSVTIAALANRWQADIIKEAAAATTSSPSSPSVAAPGGGGGAAADGGGSGGGASSPVTVMMPLFKDMSARDLIQRRATDQTSGSNKGATVWEDSPLVYAAKRGLLCVLDGVDRIPADVLNTLQRLVHDRCLDLCDGSRLVPLPLPSSSLSNQSNQQQQQQRTTEDGGGSVVPEGASLSSPGLNGGVKEGGGNDVVVGHIHPHFRIVALANSPALGKASWLGAETAALFRFHVLPSLSSSDERSVLLAKCPQVPLPALDKLLSFATTLRHGSSNSSNSSSPSSSSSSSSPSQNKLSMRQLSRIARRLESFPLSAEQDLGSLVSNALLLPFLPPNNQKAVLAAMKFNEIQPPTTANGTMASSSGGMGAPVMAPALLQEPTGGRGGGGGGGLRAGAGSSGSSGEVVTVGGVSTAKRVPLRPELVPNPLFFDNANHEALMGRMLASHLAGDRALLLIGNQGVGKNKVALLLLPLLLLPLLLLLLLLLYF
jgi:hypothetical protein